MYDVAIMYLTLATLAVLMIFSSNNSRFDEEVKGTFFTICIICMVGSATEFFSEAISIDVTENAIRLHYLLKIVELSCTPMISLVLSKLIVEDLKKVYVLKVITITNVFLQVASIWTKWIFYIDASNVYHRGDLYGVYIILYMSGIAYFVKKTYDFTRESQERNSKNLVGILIFLLTSLSIQIVVREVKTDWISLAIALSFFYTYYSNLTYQIDKLTGLFSREELENAQKKINYKTAVMMIDINYFKEINDSYGHNAGDVYIAKVAKLLRETLASYAHCYRFGGDEFCAVFKKKPYQKLVMQTPNFDSYVMLNEMIKQINTEFEKERRKDKIFPTVSVGFATHNAGDNFKNTLEIADKRMYEAKAKAHSQIKRK